MPEFHHDGIAFHYADSGEGTPFVFQHGLGCELAQPLGLFHPPAGFRLISFDCRGHGETRPVGDESRLTFATFADDLAALLDHLGVNRAVVGGVSMGAALAQAFALRHSARLLGLVLSRPAWLAGPKPETVYWAAFMARLIREQGAAAGKSAFAQTAEYAGLYRQAPEVAGSLLRQFDSPRAEDAVARLERIPPDSPCASLDDLKQIRVPTLVLANRQDPVHPFEFGQIIARSITGSRFRELTAKSVSPERHASDVQQFIEEFLVEHFGPSKR